MAILISILMALGLVSNPNTGNNYTSVNYDSNSIYTTGHSSGLDWTNNQ